MNIDEDYIPLSYISQYNYCKRRAGLLLIEKVWNESADTAKGRSEHERVHNSSVEHRGDIITLSDLAVCSKRLRLYGKCDAIEATKNPNGIEISLIDNKKYTLFPVEYKHGKLREEHEYELQLCAQAVCLEEMYNCQIQNGAIFYINSHRRKDVTFTPQMKNEVENSLMELMKMLTSGVIPIGENNSKCIKCSLKDICMPEIPFDTRKYISKIRKDFEKE